MSANKRKRNTQIPLEAIEGAAGINDITIFAPYGYGIFCGKEVEIPTKKNTTMKNINDGVEKREVVNVEDLQPGITIVAKDGGIATAKRASKEGDMEI